MTKLLFASLIAAAAVPALAQAPAPTPMMTMGHDRIMTRAEVQGHVAKMFAKADTNRDGVITKAEAEAAHKMMGGMRAMNGQHEAMDAMHRDPTAAFDRIDTNHDGMISRAEFLAAHAMRQQKMGAMQGMHGMRGMSGMRGMGDQMFERADANHDGRLTIAEAQAQAFAHFDMMDANHDGRVTPDERKAARQMMMQHKGR